MNISNSTVKAFSGLAISLEQAQRQFGNKHKNDVPPDGDYIGKMWLTPEEHAKQKSAKDK